MINNLKLINIMKPSEFVSKLVAENKLEQALKYIIDSARGTLPKVVDEASLASGRYNTNEDEYLAGTKQESLYSTELNKIRRQILSLGKSLD